LVNPTSLEGADFMDHATAGNGGSPLPSGLSRIMQRFRTLFVGCIVMSSGALCALVLLDAVAAEKASALVAVAVSGTASVRAALSGCQRASTTDEG